VDIEVVPPEPHTAPVKPSKSRYWLLVVIAAVVSLAMISGALTWRWFSSQEQHVSVSDNVANEIEQSKTTQIEKKVDLNASASAFTAMAAEKISSAKVKADLIANEPNAFYAEFVSFEPEGRVVVNNLADGSIQAFTTSENTKIYRVTQYSADQNGTLHGFSFGNPEKQIILESLAQGTLLRIERTSERLVASNSAQFSLLSVIIFPTQE
jgi:flagellar capping protein FliD